MSGLFDKLKKTSEAPKFGKPKLGEVVVSMRGITKRFPGVLANDNIDFDIKAGEIHALLGENGAGKSTLMKILYGLYQPDEGEIYIRGEKVSINSPKDAINLGIGMVHQHFMLVPPLSVTENIILGLKAIKGQLLNLEAAGNRITEFSEKYGIKVDPKAKIWQLSVGEQQRVAIMKALYREARVLILDEPTAVLTPSEIEELMETLKKMSKEGLAIVPFITHKLPEVMAISDSVTVLRGGKVVSTIDTNRTDMEDLAVKMVGRKVLFRLPRHQFETGKVILEVKDLQALNDKGLPALKGVSLTLREGEILGIAGVAGNGQRELTETITGLRESTGGKVLLFGRDMTNSSPGEIIKAGVGYIPEDRLERGLVLEFSVADNLILKQHDEPPFADSWFLPFKKNWFINRNKVGEHAEKAIAEFNIMTPSKDVPARNLSGGNLQKLLLARELLMNPKMIVAAQPTRGLDVGATEYIRKKLIEQTSEQTGVLLISEDLDEIMMMSDRIAVIYEGEIMGILPGAGAKIEDIGQMMAGAKRMASTS